MWPCLSITEEAEHRTPWRSPTIRGGEEARVRHRGRAHTRRKGRPRPPPGQHCSPRPCATETKPATGVERGGHPLLACLPELSVDLALASSPASSVAARVREEVGLAGCVEAVRRRSRSPDVGGLATGCGEAAGGWSGERGHAAGAGDARPPPEPMRTERRDRSRCCSPPGRGYGDANRRKKGK